MGRPPRIDFPLAIHHVTNKGVRGFDIFTNPSERQKFLELLDQYTDEYGITIFAYALMPNHFHLVLQSRDGRLSSFMNAFQSSYAEWFNAQGNREGGTLFQHPFWSELVQEGRYLFMAVRYVLTNPQRAGFAESDNLFHSWTSMAEWPTEGHTVTDFYSLFSHLEDVNHDSFVEYIQADPHIISNKKESETRRVRDVQVLGDNRYLEQVLDYQENPVRNQPGREGPVPPEKILASVVKYTSVSTVDQLIETKRDHEYSLVRFATYYLLRVRSHLSLSEIGEIFNITGSAVSRGISKFRERDWESVRELLEHWNINISSIK